MAKLEKTPTDFMQEFSDDYKKIDAAVDTVNSNYTDKLSEEVISNYNSIKAVADSLSGDSVILSCQEGLNDIVTTLNNLSDSLFSYKYHESKYKDPFKRELDELKKGQEEYNRLCKNGPDEEDFYYYVRTGENKYDSFLNRIEYNKKKLSWESNISDYENQLKAISDNINNIKECMTSILSLEEMKGFGDPFYYSEVNFLSFTYIYDQKDDFYEWLLGIKNSAGTFGVDQGIFGKLDQGLWWQFGHVDPEFIKIRDKFVERGMNSQDVVKFFNMIDSQGACTYARAIENLVHKYKDAPEYFEKKFGFPLYLENDDGEKVLNSGEILADLYLYVNDVKNGGKLWSTSGEFSFTGENASSQVTIVGEMDGTSDIMNKYLDEHGIDGHYNIENFYSNFLDEKPLSEDQQLLIKQEVCETIDNPNFTLDIALGRNARYDPESGEAVISKHEVKLYPVDKDGNIKPLSFPSSPGYHVVNGVSYNDQGIIVNTWGDFYLLKWENINSGEGLVMLSKVSISDSEYMG